MYVKEHWSRHVFLLVSFICSHGLCQLTCITKCRNCEVITPVPPSSSSSTPILAVFSTSLRSNASTSSSSPFSAPASSSSSSSSSSSDDGGSKDSKIALLSYFSYRFQARLHHLQLIFRGEHPYTLGTIGKARLQDVPAVRSAPVRSLK